MVDRKGTTGAGSEEVDRYLAKVPEPARATLNKIRTLIRSVGSDGSHGGHQLRDAGLPIQRGVAGVRRVSESLRTVSHESGVDRGDAGRTKRYETSKGAIRFAVDKPLPAALVKKIVKARVAENEGRKKR